MWRIDGDASASVASATSRWSTQYDNEISSIFARAHASRATPTLIDLFSKSRRPARVDGNEEWRTGISGSLTERASLVRTLTSSSFSVLETATKSTRADSPPPRLYCNIDRHSVADQSLSFRYRLHVQLLTIFLNIVNPVLHRSSYSGVATGVYGYIYPQNQSK